MPPVSVPGGAEQKRGPLRAIAGSHERLRCLVASPPQAGRRALFRGSTAVIGARGAAGVHTFRGLPQQHSRPGEVTASHPVKPLAARRAHRPPTTPSQRLKPTPSGHQRRERLNLSLRQIECTSEVRTHILSITYTISAWTMGGSPTAVLPLRCCCRGPAILRSIFGDGVDRHAVYQEPRKLAR
jgi:hypothetical protein